MDRHIPLDGCVNFRDAGGYQVVDADVPARRRPRMRWRRLFRSDALNDLSAADVALLTGNLCVTTVVDLRTDYERQRDARRPLDSTAVNIIHAPLITEQNAAAIEQPGLTLAERYVWMLELAGEPLVRAVTAVARAPGAVIVHCAAGKDRTGLIIASILGVLGVAEDDIVSDYALTTQNLRGIQQRLRQRSESYGTAPGAVIDAPAGAMREVLATLRKKHGSVADFLDRAGVAPPIVSELKATLVDSP
jgi:protein-tyrosine phosphatase